MRKLSWPGYDIFVLKKVRHNYFALTLLYIAIDNLELYIRLFTRGSHLGK